MTQTTGDAAGRPGPMLLNSRAWNVAVRTAHLASMGVLLGGHAYGVTPERLYLPLGLTVGTGVVLTLLETNLQVLWFHQGRGLITLAKLLLILAVPWFWSSRFGILLAVVVLAGVGSHAPARFRYYSVLYGKIIRCGKGPGASTLPEE